MSFAHKEFAHRLFGHSRFGSGGGGLNPYQANAKVYYDPNGFIQGLPNYALDGSDDVSSEGNLIEDANHATQATSTVRPNFNGSVVDYDGIDEYLIISADSSGFNGLDDLSVLMNIRTDASIATSQGLLASSNSAGSINWQMFATATDSLRVQVRTDVSTYSINGANGTIPIQTWATVGFRYCASETLLEAFVNGVSIGTATTDGTLRSAALPLTIGSDRDGTDRFFDGQNQLDTIITEPLSRNAFLRVSKYFQSRLP